MSMGKKPIGYPEGLLARLVAAGLAQSADSVPPKVAMER